MDACYEKAYGPLDDSTLPKEEGPFDDSTLPVEEDPCKDAPDYGACWDAGDDSTKPPTDQGVTVASTVNSTTPPSDRGVSVASAVNVATSSSTSTQGAKRTSYLTEANRPIEFTLEQLDYFWKMMDFDGDGKLGYYDHSAAS